MLVINHKRKRAEELVEKYFKCDVESYNIYRDALDGVGTADEFVAYAEKVFEKNNGKTLTEYLQKQEKGEAQNFLFGFLVGASTQRRIDDLNRKETIQ